MSNYVLSACSTADLSKEHFERRNIAYVCYHFDLSGQSYPDDLGQSVPFDEFYARIAAGEDAKTSQVNTFEYLEYFSSFLKEGKDVIHLTLSSGITGSYQAAESAAVMAREQFPDRKLYVIDSRGASSGYGLLMDKLADLRDEGMGIDELAAWAEAHRLNLHHWFFSTDLTFYIKGGRVSKTAGTIGTLLGICPLLHMDEPGHLIVFEKVRSKKKVIQAIVRHMVEHADGGTEYSGKCYISNSACPEDARAVADLVEKTFPGLDGKVEIYSIGTVIGSHTGPGTVALFFWGDTRE